MSGLRAALALAAASASCGPVPNSVDAESIAPQTVVISTPSASSFEALDGPSDRLSFLTSDLRSEPPPLLEADCASSPDGGLLVRFASSDGEGFHGAICFLDLAPAPERRRLRAAGVLHWSDVGMGWVRDLAGSVTMDTTDPEEILCRLDLVDRPGMGSAFLRRSFRIVPAREVKSVRDDIARWPNERELPRMR
jgi:hypothetical protein